MNANPADVSVLLEEYTTLVDDGRRKIVDNAGVNWDAVVDLLQSDADWTPAGAAAVACVVRDYGSFVLRNALALALALNIEDGERGL